jgi:hypothetical protein
LEACIRRPSPALQASNTDESAKLALQASKLAMAQLKTGKQPHRNRVLSWSLAVNIRRRGGLAEN